MTLSPLGDSAVVVALGPGLDEAALWRVRALAEEIERNRPEGVTDVVPAFGSVTVFYDAAHCGGYTKLCAEIEARAGRSETAVVSQRAKVLEIPVCYGGDWGVDLGEVAMRTGVSVEQVVALHTGVEYLVHAIGFAPGFAYLGGLPVALHTPRRATPRTTVPAGTVGIGGAQTGVYPLATPGGWNLIGRTPLKLFEAGRAEPALLKAGDKVKFRAISAEEFATWR
jgi:inhibitor of KinA